MTCSQPSRTPSSLTFRGPDRLADTVVCGQVCDAADLPGPSVQHKQSWSLLARVQLPPVLLCHRRSRTCATQGSFAVCMFCKVLQDQARCSAAKVEGGACLTLFLVLVPLTYDGQDQPQAELEVVTQHRT